MKKQWLKKREERARKEQEKVSRQRATAYATLRNHQKREKDSQWRLMLIEHTAKCQLAICRTYTFLRHTTKDRCQKIVVAMFVNDFMCKMLINKSE